jgi:cytidylate kinase
MVITIDGPAGTGKSSVARAVAESLDFDFLDTGAMYRAVALAALRAGANLEDAGKLEAVAREARIEYDFSSRPPEVFLNGEAVGKLLRSAQATRGASYVAQVPGIREMLVAQQRRIGQSRPNVVTEGRDQGTIVFPEAELKFYLDASPAERARRRAEQLRAAGETVDEKELQRQINERDARDSGRAVGPLSVPPGARVIDTTEMSERQVIDRIVLAVREIEKA